MELLRSGRIDVYIARDSDHAFHADVPAFIFDVDMHAGSCELFDFDEAAERCKHRAADEFQGLYGALGPADRRVIV